MRERLLPAVRLSRFDHMVKFLTTWSNFFTTDEAGVVRHVEEQPARERLLRVLRPMVKRV